MRAPLPLLLLALLAPLCGTSCAEPPPKPAVAPEPAVLPLIDPETLTDGELFAAALTQHRRHRYVGDLEEVRRRGVLRVITRNGSTSYFLHRGSEAGFHYELAKLLADELGVRLEVVVPRAPRDMVPWLLQGRGDIIIGGMPVDAPRASRVRATRPYLQTAHVVVAHKDRVPAIQSVPDLRSATLLVHPSSSAVKRLRSLSQATGLPFNVRAARETFHSEDMLDDVAGGRADCAIVQKRLALVELAYRDDLEIVLELPTGIVESAFFVHPDNSELYEAADDFLRRHYRGTIFNLLYWRYHKPNLASTSARAESGLRADQEGGFTVWDEHFQAAAAEHGLDWRLLVAQAYQESRLDPLAESPYGAQGLMQMMPATAAELGVKDPFDAVQSIKGGAAYMKKLMDRFEQDGVELKDRIRFALASYNVGYAHLDDARILAAAEGLDPNRWFGNVEQSLLLLSKPRYFKTARYGYCRGEEPVRYVSAIQTRYDAYVSATTQEPPQ